MFESSRLTCCCHVDAPESKLSRTPRHQHSFRSETQTSFEEKTSRFALKNMPVHLIAFHLISELTMNDLQKSFFIVSVDYIRVI